MPKLRVRVPSPAMIVALIALVLAATGSAIAATALVSGDKIIKRGSLSGNRLRAHTLSGTQINLKKLGKVPSAAVSDTAGTAGSANTANTATTAASANTANSATTAKQAETAKSATTAGSANTATTAGSANTATTANTANVASTAGDVGGYSANMLNRIAQGGETNLFALSSTETNGTVTISAPAAGFVKVEARFLATDAFAGAVCNKCVVIARLHDNGGAGDSPATLATVGAAPVRAYFPLSLDWVYTADKGPHSYSLTTTQLNTGGPLDIFNVVLIAQFVPFGSTGTSTTLSVTHDANHQARDGSPVWRAP
jgi:hypothetical protein